MARPARSQPLPSPGVRPAAAPGAGTGAADHERHERDQRLATLLAAAAAGDAGAFETFYEATFAYARTVARRLLRDNAEIEDLLADCYFEAWRRVAAFDPARGSPVTWLLMLVRSRGLDALRAAAARPDRVGLAAAVADDTREGGPHGHSDEKCAASDIPDGPSSTDVDPAERLWRRQAGAQLQAALAALSAPERWVLGLAYLRELSHAEIARCTGMPLGTVKSHALRAHNKLRDLLGPGLLGLRGHGEKADALKTTS